MKMGSSKASMILKVIINGTVSLIIPSSVFLLHVVLKQSLIPFGWWSLRSIDPLSLVWVKPTTLLAESDSY